MGFSLLFIFFSGFGLNSHATQPTENCSIDFHVPAEYENALNETFAFLSKIEGIEGSPLHQRALGGSVSGDTYCRYLRSSILNIYFEPDAKATQVARYDDGRVMYLSPLFFKESVLGRASVLLHEAAHDKGERWDHVQCPMTFRDQEGKDIVGKYSGKSLAGAWACDDFALGSYGTEIIFLRNLEKKCSNCSSEVKNEARETADRLLYRIINAHAKSTLIADEDMPAIQGHALDSDE